MANIKAKKYCSYAKINLFLHILKKKKTQMVIITFKHGLPF